jgi:hypothetical protein
MGLQDEASREDVDPKPHHHPSRQAWIMFLSEGTTRHL